MSKIIIIGGGFAGLAAAEYLATSHKTHQTTLIDKKDSSQFLPMLPDIVGQSLNPEALAYPLKEAAKRWNFDFLQEKVIKIDLREKVVHTESKKIPYDGLIICGGSKTNLSPCKSWVKPPYKLDSIENALEVRKLVESSTQKRFIVCGGGYTGVELASNIDNFLKKIGLKRKVTIVERGSSLCSALPPRQIAFIEKEVRKAGIEVKTQTSMTGFDGNKVSLSDGTDYDNALALWAAGVCTDDFIRQLSFNKDSQGRLEVDECLQLGNGVFAAGDAAGFKYKNKKLRMGVQFSLSEGQKAAENLLRHLDKKALKPFYPLDPGWVVPLANKRGCGTILGVQMFGRIPYFLHMLVCLGRSVGLKNRYKLVEHFWK
ncbi:MAG: NAD(P)/FAD-dependent oxidoreductase [Candidatus Rifleibacteriota bacterium]